MGYIGCRTVCTAGILYFNGKYTKKSQRLTVRVTTELFLVTPQSAVL